MHSKITNATATLSQLRPGQEYPDGNINARSHYTDEEIEELAASLKGPDGQLRPFLVATHPKKPGVFFVFGGGRRRLAYERLIGSGHLPKDHPIEIKDHGHISVDEALSKSLADNQAVPMHPADQAATFAKLAANKSPEDIAKERGMTVRAVQQSIALGTALAPEVIAAWRAGKLSRDEVQVFTIGDFEAQAKALSDSWAFSNNRGIDIRDIRRKLTRNKEPDMKRLLGFVGIDAARAGGVEVAEDFFGSGGVVKDMKPLKALAKAKMAGLAADLGNAGWLWVETTLDQTSPMHHGYSEISVNPAFTAEEKERGAAIKRRLKEIEKEDGQDTYFEETALENEQEAIENGATFRAFTEKHRAKSGVIVALSPDGAVIYTGGLIRKEENKSASGTKSTASRTPEPAKPVIPDISREVEETLEDMQGDVLAELIAGKPKEAFALFLAAIRHCDWNGAVMWRDVEDHADDLPGKDFATAFAALRKLPMDKMAAKLAVMVGKVTNVWRYQSGDKDAKAIVDLIGEKALQAGLAKRFDAKAYVAGATKQHLLGILAEASGPKARDEHERDAEAALRLPVVTAIKASGWLPPQLRTGAYTGPSAKKKAKP